jgi:hypothetical protein
MHAYKVCGAHCSFFEPGSFAPHSHALCMEIRWALGFEPGWPSSRCELLTKRAHARSQVLIAINQEYKEL